MSTRVAVFDLDGTLIDSAPDLYRAVNRLLAELQCAALPLDAVRGMIGDGAALLVKRALEARGCEPSPDEASALRRFLHFYGEDPTALTQVYPGVHQTLHRLVSSGVALGVCTNKPAGLTRAILAQLDLEPFFAEVVGGDSLPFRKPDPRGVLEVVSSLGAKPSESILVGDSEIDAATAHAAGMPFALVTYGYHRGPIEAIECVAALEDFSELAELIDPSGG